MGCGSGLIGNAITKLNPPGVTVWVSAALASFMHNSEEGHLLSIQNIQHNCVC